MNGMATDHDEPLAPGKLPGAMLDRLVQTYRTRPDPTVVVGTGYGRDAAAVTVGNDGPLIIKSDPITFATDNAAHYLVAVNANDIACLGGIARWISVVLLLPVEAVTEANVERLFSDLQAAANAADVSLVGGHTEVTPAVTRPVFVATMLGTPGPSGLLAPGRGQPGDDIYLTQSAGLEGTALLAREIPEKLTESLGSDIVAQAASLLDSPGISITHAAGCVLETGYVTALHDPTEGGVATAVHEMAAASDCGARIDVASIPILPQTGAICDLLGIAPLGLISSGALLVAARPEGRDALARATVEHGIPLAKIGHLANREDGVRMSGGEPLPRFDADEITRVL